jgi:hypothetical protein
VTGRGAVQRKETKKTIMPKKVSPAFVKTVVFILAIFLFVGFFIIAYYLLDYHIVPFKEIETSTNAENGGIVLDCISDGPVLHFELPIYFDKVYEEEFRKGLTVSAYTEDRNLSVNLAAISSAPGLLGKDAVIYPECIQWTSLQDEINQNDGHYTAYTVSERKEQVVNGHFCIWNKYAFSINERDHGIIIGNMNSEDRKNGIAITLFAEGADAINRIDDTWQEIISGIRVP